MIGFDERNAPTLEIVERFFQSLMKMAILRKCWHFLCSKIIILKNERKLPTIFSRPRSLKFGDLRCRKNA